MKKEPTKTRACVELTAVWGNDDSDSTKVSGISKSNIPKLLLSFPPLPEQAAIAAVLSDMDGELAALEERREKVRLVKQGMMQELLTGRTRLV
jgi:type I restriction enzyme S subunit